MFKIIRDFFLNKVINPIKSFIRSNRTLERVVNKVINNPAETFLIGATAAIYSAAAPIISAAIVAAGLICYASDTTGELASNISAAAFITSLICVFTPAAIYTLALMALAIALQVNE